MSRTLPRGIRPWGPGVALLVMTVVAYLPAYRAGFIWDDDDYVTENTTLRDLDGLRRIWVEPRATPQYYPLVHTSFWIECRLWGLWAPGFHATNIALHGISAVLVWLTLRRLEAPGAWLAAAIFALHPVHVESVAWITERKNVLSAAFGLAALLLMLGVIEPWRDGDLTKRWWRYAASTILFVAALLSKTVICSLPVVVLVLVWYRRGSVTRQEILAMVPWLLLGSAAGLSTAILEREHVGALGSAFDLSSAERMIIAGRAVWFYGWKLLWPVDLAFMYPRWKPDAFTATDWLYPAAVAVLTLVFWMGRHRWGRAPLTCLAIFLITIFPALGFVNVYPMRYTFVADHYQYLASLGPIAGLAAAMCGIPVLQHIWVSLGAIRISPFGLMRVVLLAALGTLTWRQEGIYLSRETLWADVLRKNPQSYVASFQLGRVRLEQRRFDESTELFRDALRRQIDEMETDVVETMLALSLVRGGDSVAAQPHFEEALRRNPSNFEALNGLANLFSRAGETADAIPLFHRALAIHPENAAVHQNLANALAVRGDLEAAIAKYIESLRLDPRSATTHLNYGNALARLRRFDEAEQQYVQALKLDPGLDAARKLLLRIQSDQEKTRDSGNSPSAGPP